MRKKLEHSKGTRVSRWKLLVAGAAGLVGLMSGGSIAKSPSSPSSAFGRFFSPSVALARNANGKHANGHVNGRNGAENNYKTVSIRDMKRWNRESVKYRLLGSARVKNGFATAVKVRFNGAIFVATGLVDYTGKLGKKMTFEYKDNLTGKIRRFKDIDLQSLARLYEQKTSKRFTSFEIVVETGKDEDVGDYVQFWVVPNGEIKPGVPVLPAYAYYQGNIGTSNKPDLLAFAR